MFSMYHILNQAALECGNTPLMVIVPMPAPLIEETVMIQEPLPYAPIPLQLSKQDKGDDEN